MKQNNKQAGFTIIELMLATMVFSVILVMVTIVITGIGRLYYKGINQSRVQDNVRVISDEVADRLRLGNNFQTPPSPPLPYNSPTPVTPAVQERAYCMGTTRYTYVLNRQIGDDTSPDRTQVKHVLWRDTVPSGSCLTDPNNDGDVITDGTLPNLMAATPSAGGIELIAPGSRLSEFTIVDLGGGNSYRLNLLVSYGDNDLLDGGRECKGQVADQFCAAAGLTTSVVRRLN